MFLSDSMLIAYPRDLLSVLVYHYCAFGVGTDYHCCKRCNWWLCEHLFCVLICWVFSFFLLIANIYNMFTVYENRLDRMHRIKLESYLKCFIGSTVPHQVTSPSQRFWAWINLCMFFLCPYRLLTITQQHGELVNRRNCPNLLTCVCLYVQWTGFPSMVYFSLMPSVPADRLCIH